MKTIIQRLEADEFKQILDGEKSYIVFKGEAQSGQRILLQTETEELDCTVGLVATSPGVFKGHSILTLQRPTEKVPPSLEFTVPEDKWAGVAGRSDKPLITSAPYWVPLSADDVIPPAGDPLPAPAFPNDRQDPPM